jgi:hypothetical protein
MRATDIIRQVLNMIDAIDTNAAQGAPHEEPAEISVEIEAGTDDELARILKGADNPENWSKRDLEDARDEALDNEDYKLVAYYQTLIDRKS